MLARELIPARPMAQWHEVARKWGFLAQTTKSRRDSLWSPTEIQKPRRHGAVRLLQHPRQSFRSRAKAVA